VQEAANRAVRRSRRQSDQVSDDSTARYASVGHPNLKMGTQICPNNPDKARNSLHGDSRFIAEPSLPQPTSRHATTPVQ
jgi:hypothetical protein